MQSQAANSEHSSDDNPKSKATSDLRTQSNKHRHTNHNAKTLLHSHVLLKKSQQCQYLSINNTKFRHQFGVAFQFMFGYRKVGIVVAVIEHICVLQKFVVLAVDILLVAVV